jgi:hypothetical protein
LAIRGKRNTTNTCKDSCAYIQLISLREGGTEPDMKDITSTTFGYLIAYVLPGTFCLIGLGIIIEPIRKQLLIFSTEQSNISHFLLFLFCSIILSLELQALRFIIFEKIKKNKIDTNLFDRLNNIEKLTAFKAAVDEHYRYHQFWGGLLIPIIIFFYALIKKKMLVGLFALGIGLLFLFVILIVTYLAAYDSYEKYVERSKKILKGGKDG